MRDFKGHKTPTDAEVEGESWNLGAKSKYPKPDNHIKGYR